MVTDVGPGSCGVYEERSGQWTKSCKNSAVCGLLEEEAEGEPLRARGQMKSVYVSGSPANVGENGGKKRHAQKQ